MKYVVLIYTNPATWETMPKEELDGLMAEFDAQHRELEASGEFVAGSALAPPAEGRTIRVREGSTSITDGPFAEAKEHLAGYFVVECDGIERAAEIAAADPNARLGAVEVRQIVDEVG
jgi:hypothetical protein